MTMTQVPEREEITKQETWNSESVFADHAAWSAEFDAVKADIDALESYAGTLSQGADRWADWLDISSAISRRLSKLYFYAVMSVSVNSGDIASKKLVGQISGLLGAWSAMTAFYEPELLAIGQDTLQQWVNDNPRVQIYAHHVDQLFLKADHVRSADVEGVMGAVNEPFGAVSNIASELTGTDLTFADAVDSDGTSYPVTQSTWFTYLQMADRTLRQTTWESYSDSHKNFENTLSATYTASVKQTVFKTRTRNYKSSLEHQLKPNNIPVEVFHNLINTYKANLPTWHRYWEIKRRALGYDQLRPFDIWAPIREEREPITFEQSVEWISAGMQPLGEDYVNVLRQGCLENRWVDRAVNKGKRNGAFSFGTYDTFPFIMMSYDNSLKAMSTLAHELGHSMHSYLSRKHQPYVYSGYTMFVAEVASNFNQALTRAYLLEEKKDDADFQIALIEEAMTNFHRYFFIMPTLARFELEVHTRVENGQPITADILNGLMSDLFAEGYGDTLTDDRDRTGITWAQFGHLYVPFYTFQYATGISAAHALADKVLNGDEQDAENYRTFLKTGSALYPIDALKVAGVDMSTPEAVETTFALLGDMVDRLEKLTS